MEFGDYRVEIIPDTEFRLDGGAMFGVVPRVLWERFCRPDDKNRVRLNMNCVFIDTGKEKILIETGIGEKWSAKETEMYGIRRERPFAESLCQITGSRPEDITIVINTHLHFDHAGGNTIPPTGPHAARVPAADENARPNTSCNTGNPASVSLNNVDAREPRAVRSVAQFPNARYMVSKAEFDHAQNPHERDKASYLPENWLPLEGTMQLEFMPDRYEPVPGLRIEMARGHSETMQTWRLDIARTTLYGFADLIPTRHHLHPAWVMGYDLYPVETMEFKKRVIPQAVAESWYCLFYHDFEHPLCRLEGVDGKIQAKPVA